MITAEDDRAASGSPREVALLRREVVVVGAGPAGSATAALLSAAGHQVLLLDRARFPRPKPCAEYTSPGTEEILDRLGVLRQVECGLGRRLRGMELIAPGGGRYLVEYRLADRRRDAFSFSRLHLDAALLATARQHGAEVWEGFRASSVLVSEGRVRGVVGRDGEGRAFQVLARLVVGADGLYSVVARGLGLFQPSAWPRRLGLVTHYQGVPWPEDYGQMRLGRGGYVGTAPVTDDLLVVGLVIPMPTQPLGIPRTTLQGALGRYPDLAERLAQGRPASAVQGVGPLARSVRSCAGDGYVLVGDAAGSLDPLTGEGIYRALRGAELAAQVTDKALQADDLSASRLEEYQTLRAREFGAKERLTRLIQYFVQAPPLMDYAVARLRRRQEPARVLSLALGDLAPVEQVLRPGALWALLKP